MTSIISKRIIYIFLGLSLFLGSCSLFKGSGTANPYQENLIGKWLLQSMKQGDKMITKDIFGGNASIEFFKNGKIVTQFPKQKATTSQYFLEGKKIIDMGSSDGKSMEIVLLEGNQLTLSMNIDKSSKVRMHFEKHR